MLKLEKPLYGICDSRDYWGAKFSFFIKKKLGMFPLDGYPSLYMNSGEKTTDGLLGAYVDDNLFSGNATLNELVDLTARSFE